jgi:predicted O-methyltransferase YrrM
MSWSLPIKTDWMLTQESHEPSMLYAQDIYRVASRMPKGFIALEIGMAWGFSTLAILEAGAQTLLSVDPNVLAKGLEESEASGYKNHAWTCCKSTEYWKENNSTIFDLIYVDGSHLYADVKEDLYEAWKRLKKDGMLLIDDWEHKNNIKRENDTTEYGVSLACWEFWKDHVKEVKDVGIEGRVLWFRK